MRNAPIFLLLAACAAPTSISDSGVPSDASGPVVRVHLRANGAPTPHPPGTVGQTPDVSESGIRSLTLLRSMDDPSPLVVFDHPEPVVASYVDGADTIVGTAPVASLASARFTVARAVHTHAHFVVDATLHYAGSAIPGTIDETIALSDGTTIDGVARARGWTRTVFEAASMTFPQESTVEPPTLASGGFTVRVEDGEAAYYFPIDLLVSPDVDHDVDLIFEVAVHEPVRWIDEDAPGYAPGVLDVTPTSYEPIVQVGASGYRLFVE